MGLPARHQAGSPFAIHAGFTGREISHLIEITVSARHGPFSGRPSADQYHAETSVHVLPSPSLAIRS